MGFLKIFRLSFCLLLLFGHPCCVFSQYTILYTSSPKTIDGLLDDWSLNDSTSFIVKQDPPYSSNKIFINTAWDEHNLYLLYRVYDKHFINISTGNNNHLVWRNDGVEFYIDPQNDSKNRMDINDYQFMLDINGYYTVSKGDKAAIDDSTNLIPGEIGTATIAFEHSAKYYGTTNNNKDCDSLYIIEAALPWAALGVVPKTGYELKVDFCCNDPDSLVHNITDNFHAPDQPAFKFMSIKGITTIYGFPNNWLSAKLTGRPGIIDRFKKKYAGQWLFISSPVIIVLFVIIFILYRKIIFLRKIPQKQDLKNLLFIRILEDKKQTEQEKTKQEQKKSEPPEIKETLNKSNRNSELITELKKYVLENLDQNISAEDLAKKSGFTLRNIQFIFKRELDTNPTTFILLLKMEQAAQLLTTGKKNISEVAYNIGFSNPSYFSSVFKKYFNVTPKEFVKEIAEKAK